jgi:hypothetical protein
MAFLDVTLYSLWGIACSSTLKMETVSSSRTQYLLTDCNLNTCKGGEAGWEKKEWAKVTIWDPYRPTAYSIGSDNSGHWAYLCSTRLNWTKVTVLYFSILLHLFNTEYLFFCLSM